MNTTITIDCVYGVYGQYAKTTWRKSFGYVLPESETLTICPGVVANLCAGML